MAANARARSLSAGRSHRLIGIPKWRRAEEFGGLRDIGGSRTQVGADCWRKRFGGSIHGQFEPRAEGVPATLLEWR